MSNHLRPLATVIVAATVVAAGCGSGSDRAAPVPTSSSGSTHGEAVRFAECMRTNGVVGFPDPDASGQLTIDAVLNGSTIDPSSATWKRAITACQNLQPPGFTGTGRTAAQQKAALEFAQCVRNHGVSDFPDPTTDSPLIDTTKIPSANQNGGLAALNAATHACGSFAKDAGVTGP